MIPANSLVVVCPHCGSEKELIQLVSGNTFGAKNWSDMRQIASMLPRISPLQRCPGCGHYYWTHKCEKKQGKGWSFEEGWLTFAEMKDALKEAESWNLDDADKYTIGVLAVWAYNDIIRDGMTPSDEDANIFKDIVANLLPLLDDNKLLAAELYREIGEFDKCLSTIAEVDTTDEYVKPIVDGIAERASQHDSLVWMYSGE